MHRSSPNRLQIELTDDQAPLRSGNRDLSGAVPYVVATMIGVLTILLLNLANAAGPGESLLILLGAVGWSAWLLSRPLRRG